MCYLYKTQGKFAQQVNSDYYFLFSPSDIYRFFPPKCPIISYICFMQEQTNKKPTLKLTLVLSLIHISESKSPHSLSVLYTT